MEGTGEFRVEEEGKVVQSSDLLGVGLPEVIVVSMAPKLAEEMLVGRRVIGRWWVLDPELHTTSCKQKKMNSVNGKAGYLRGRSTKSKLVCFLSSRSSFSSTRWGSMGFSSGAYTASPSLIAEEFLIYFKHDNEFRIKLNPNPT